MRIVLLWFVTIYSVVTLFIYVMHLYIMMTSSAGIIFRVTGPFWGEIHRSSVDSPLKGPVTRSVGVFFDLRLNKRWSKDSRRRWFRTPCRSLWRHCNMLLFFFGQISLHWAALWLLYNAIEVTLQPQQNITKHGLCDDVSRYTSIFEFGVLLLSSVTNPYTYIGLPTHTILTHFLCSLFFNILKFIKTMKWFIIIYRVYTF